MRPLILSALFITLPLGCTPKDDGKTAHQRRESEKTDESAKKGALAQKDDPAADLKKQKANLAKLRANIEGDRHAGNRMGAWAAERDAKTVEQLIVKDEEKLGAAR